MNSRDRRVPWIIAGALLLLSALWRYGHIPAALALLLGVAGAVAVLCGLWPALDRTAERVYAALVLSGSGWFVWLVARAPARKGEASLWVGSTLVLLLAAPVLGLPWWLHRRVRGPVRVAPELKGAARRQAEQDGQMLLLRWGEAAEAAGIAGSTALWIEYRSAEAWEIRLEHPRGKTAEHIKSAAASLESVLRTPVGAVEVAPDPMDAGCSFVRMARGAPLSQERTWSGPAKSRSVLDPITLGHFQDGTPARVLLAFVHWLIAGMSGSGKSVLLNRVVGELAACDDVVILGADLKDGLELTPWGTVNQGGVFEHIATTVEGTEAMLERVVAELHRRGRLMGSLKWKKWKPSPEYPALVVLVDEQGRLSDSERAVVALVEIAEQGRAKGIWLVSSFQKATNPAFGSNRIRNNMDVTICLRVFNAAEARVVFGEHANQSGWRPDKIPPGQPGTFYLLAASNTNPRLARAENVPDSLVERLRRQFSPRRPRLAPPPLVTARPDASRYGSRGNSPAGSAPSDHTQSDEPDGSGGGEDDVLGILRDASEPLQFAEIQERSEASRATVRRRLNAYRDNRPPLAEQLGDGRWRAI